MLRIGEQRLAGGTAKERRVEPLRVAQPARGGDVRRVVEERRVHAGRAQLVGAEAGDPLHAVASAYEQSLLNERTSTEDGVRYLEEVGAYLEALPPDGFPHLAALAPELAQGDPGERFEFGLDVLVAGLAAYGRRASTA